MLSELIFSAFRVLARRLQNKCFLTT